MYCCRLFLCLRQGFSLTLNTFCSPGWLRMKQSTCLRFQNAELTDLLKTAMTTNKQKPTRSMVKCWFCSRIPCSPLFFAVLALSLTNTAFPKTFILGRKGCSSPIANYTLFQLKGRGFWLDSRKWSRTKMRPLRAESYETRMQSRRGNSFLS